MGDGRESARSAPIGNCDDGQRIFGSAARASRRETCRRSGRPGEGPPVSGRKAGAKLSGPLRGVSRARIVLAIIVAMLAVFALTLNGFLAADNIPALLRSVAAPGIPGLGMLVVALGRGIDLRWGRTSRWATS